MPIETLRNAVHGAASAIAVTAKLSPGSGNRVMPPTYAGEQKSDPPRHNMTKPGPDGRSSWCSLDAPGSFANRAERALVQLRLDLDPLRVKLSDKEIRSTMELPHRVFDAVLRDSARDGTRFRDTEIGQAVIAATPADAGALLRYDPGALVFGAWDSTGLGANSRPCTAWARILTGEIAATQVEPVHLAGNRLDPIRIEGTDYTWVEEADGTLRLASADELRPEREGGMKRAGDKDRTYPRLVKVSKANHGNALSFAEKGVLVHGEITLNATLSLSRLRRYHFGDQTQDGRLLLALMGLYGVLAVMEDSLDLRSGCDLTVDDYRIELTALGVRTPLNISLSTVKEALSAQANRVERSDVVFFEPTKGLRDIRAASQ